MIHGKTDYERVGFVRLRRMLFTSEAVREDVEKKMKLSGLSLIDLLLVNFEKGKFFSSMKVRKRGDE